MGVMMNETSPTSDAHVVSPRRRRQSPRRHFEWRVVDIAPDVSRSEARGLLTEHAEYGQWELARSVLYIGGARRVWLRRRVMRLQRTNAV
jgi:CBS domain-containing protein